MALKQATGKYGGSGNNSANGSRRGSSAHNFGSAVIGMSALAGIGAVAERNISNVSATPSPRNLSQISLQDSGYAEPSAGNFSRSQLIGSTPQLNLYATNRHNSNGISGKYIFLKINFLGPSAPFSSAMARNGLTGVCSTNAVSGGRRPKLSEKMKSLSLDCAEMGPSNNFVNANNSSPISNFSIF